MKKLLFVSLLMAGFACNVLTLDGAALNDAPKQNEAIEERKQEESAAPECSICLELRGDSEFSLLLPCAHVFHCECIEAWVVDHGKDTCPNCRALVNDIHLMLGKYPFTGEILIAVCLEGIQRDNLNVVKFAIKHHVDVNIVLGALGFTFLHMAVGTASVGIINALLDAGADPNCRTKCRTAKGRQTPLHMALYKGKRDMAVELLKHGARTGIKDATSKTALQIIKECGDADLLALVKQ